MEKGKIYINTPNVAIFDSKNGLVKTFDHVIDVGYSDTTTGTGKVVFTYTEPVVAWAEDLQGRRYSYASESTNIATFATNEYEIIDQKGKENGK